MTVVQTIVSVLQTIVSVVQTIVVAVQRIVSVVQRIVSVVQTIVSAVQRIVSAIQTIIELFQELAGLNILIEFIVFQGLYCVFALGAEWISFCCARRPFDKLKDDRFPRAAKDSNGDPTRAGAKRNAQINLIM